MVKIELDPLDYWKKLDRYEKRPEKKRAGSAFSGKVEKDKMGKKRRDINRTSIRKKSTTDPDATLFLEKRHKKPTFIQSPYRNIYKRENHRKEAASSSVTHDISKVPQLLESHEKVLGEVLWIAADSKYGAVECLAYLHNKNIKTAIMHEGKTNRPGHFIKDDFVYDKDRLLYLSK